MSPRPRKASDDEVFEATQRAMTRLGPAELTLADGRTQLGGLDLRLGAARLQASADLGQPLRADRYDWLLLTSRNGVDALFPRLDGPLPRVAVVGRGTAEALREHSVEPALVAAVSTQEGLAAELPRPAGRVLFAGAEDARDVGTVIEGV